MFKLAIVSIILALTGANAFWNECGGTVTFYSIISPDCDDYSCSKVRGDAFTTSAMFTVPDVHNSLRVVAKAYVHGIPLPIDVLPPYDNACNNLLNYYNEPSGCPVVPYEIYKWELQLVFPDSFPSSAETKVQYELIDEQSEVVACFDFNVVLF